VKTVNANTVTAMPRLTAENMSAKTAATTANGADPNNPAKKRQIKTVWRSFPAATAKLKMAIANGAMSNGNLLPFSSDNGAQKMGPKAKPVERRQFEIQHMCSNMGVPKT
jgi:hypothetical protein